ncbi:unnamed protein product [Discosporangium mesarthrocarpum]
MRKFSTPSGAPASASSVRSCVSWLWLGPGSYPLRAWFDGKIGIWPVIETSKAKRSTKNRAAGYMEIKTVIIDGKQYNQVMIKEVIPAIKARIPGASTRTIWVQQDGANLHARNGFIAAIEKADGVNIILETQPPNSPDVKCS